MLLSSRGKCGDIIGEWVLVAGLAAELIHIACIDWLDEDLPHAVLDGKRKAIGNIVCTFLILAGVGIENWAGGGADNVIRQMRQPRSLTIPQREIIAQSLTRLAGQRAWVVVYPVTSESVAFANQIEDT